MLDTSRSLRLKGNFFARPDWFRTDVTRGVTRNPLGERVCTLTSDFLLGFRDAMIYECGPAASAVLKSAGKRWGGQFAHRLDKAVKEFYGTPWRELQRGVQITVLTEAFAAHGWGRLSVDWERWPDYLGVRLENSIYPDLILQADKPSDALFAGFLKSIFEYLLETQLECLQTDCPTCEATASGFVLGTPAAIQDVEARFAKTLGREGTLREVLAS